MSIAVDVAAEAHVYAVGSFHLNDYRVLWHSGPGASSRQHSVVLPAGYHVTELDLVASRDPLAILEELGNAGRDVPLATLRALRDLTRSELFARSTCQAERRSRLAVERRVIDADGASHAGLPPVTIPFAFQAPEGTEVPYDMTLLPPGAR